MQRSAAFDGDRASTYRPDRLANEVNVHFCCILLEFKKHLVNVLFCCKLDHRLELFLFHEDGIIVFAEKYFYLILEDFRVPLNDQVDVSKGDILYLRFSTQQRDERWSELSNERC